MEKIRDVVIRPKRQAAVKGEAKSAEIQRNESDDNCDDDSDDFNDSDDDGHNQLTDDSSSEEDKEDQEQPESEILGPSKS